MNLNLERLGANEKICDPIICAMYVNWEDTELTKEERQGL